MLNNIIKIATFQNKVANRIVVCSLLLSSAVSFGASNTDIFDYMGTTLNQEKVSAVSNFVMYGALMIGVCLFIGAFFMIKQHSEKGEPTKGLIAITFFVAVGLMSVPFFLGIVGSTVTGSDDVKNGQAQLFKK